jgi:hypothetical protein
MKVNSQFFEKENRILIFFVKVINLNIVIWKISLQKKIDETFGT